MSQKCFFVEGNSTQKKRDITCKACKNSFKKKQLKIARLVGSGGGTKLWYHVNCLFNIFQGVRTTTLKITHPESDIEGWSDLAEHDKMTIAEKVAELATATTASYPFSNQDPALFSTFCNLCKCLEGESKDKKKSETISSYLSQIWQDNELSICIEGEPQSEFSTENKEEITNVVLVVRMLLPQSYIILKPLKIIKIFSQLYKHLNEKVMREEYKKNKDVSFVIANAFSVNNNKDEESSISLVELNNMLFELSEVLKEETEEPLHKTMRKILERLRSREEVINFIRLIVGNLRLKCNVKHILNGVGNGAYDAYCTSRDINEAVSVSRRQTSLTTIIAPRVLVPVTPMSAQLCQSLTIAVKKLGRDIFYSDVTYGGEQVQIHKKENRLVIFSYTLKSKVTHKVEYVQEYMVDAFPEADTIILDAEMVMVSKKTGKPILLNERNEVDDSVNNCLFVFDILLYNGENMLNRPLSDRRALLERIMIEQRNRVVLSRSLKIKNGKEELEYMLHQESQNGLKGVIIKDIDGKYEPGKKHWLKIKNIKTTNNTSTEELEEICKPTETKRAREEEMTTLQQKKKCLPTSTEKQ